MPDVVIVGAGQAGLAASACLSRQGIDHIVLERHEIGASWRRQRWDSFCLVTPNWTVRLPGQAYDGTDPDGFMPGRDFVTFLETYADRFALPVQGQTEVRAATPENGGWVLQTSAGPMRARALIVATSTYQSPSIPAFAQRISPAILSLSAADYHVPDQLPPGRVLVVGSAQSGGQIVEDLLASGREVLLSVSRAGRVPRRYRGRDAIEWQDLMGFLDRPAAALDDPRKRFGGEPHMTGRGGGHTVSLQHFHTQGVCLVGRALTGDGSILNLARDLRENMAGADRFAAGFAEDIDAYIASSGLSAPPDRPEPDHAPIDSLQRFAEPDSLDLAAEGVSAIIWATGFRFDFSWIAADMFDAFGYPVTDRGVTATPGLYFLGLNYMHSRKSGIIYGVGDDAIHVTAQLRSFLNA